VQAERARQEEVVGCAQWVGANSMAVSEINFRNTLVAARLLISLLFCTNWLT